MRTTKRVASGAGSTRKTEISGPSSRVSSGPRRRGAAPAKMAWPLWQRIRVEQASVEISRRRNRQAFDLMQHAAAAGHDVEIGDRAGDQRGTCRLVGWKGKRLGSRCHPLGRKAGDVKHDPLAFQHGQGAVDAGKAGERPARLDPGHRDAPFEIVEPGASGRDGDLGRRTAAVFPWHDAVIGGTQNVHDASASLECRVG